MTDICNNMPGQSSCGCGNGFGEALSLVNNYCTRQCPNDLFSGKITEDLAAEQAYAAAHHINADEVKIYTEGAYTITILANSGANAPGGHDNTEEVIIHDNDCKSNTPDTIIWGDPHVNSAGENFTFSQNLDFKLKDGTDISIGVEKYGKNSAFLVSTVEISNKYSNVSVSGVGSYENSAEGDKLSASEIFSGPSSNIAQDVIQQNIDGTWSFGNGELISAANYNSDGDGIDSSGDLKWKYQAI